MSHIRCAWNHQSPDQPIIIYSELDDQRRELRKVEVFRGGRMGFANSEREFGGSALGLEPLPPLADIAADPQFEPFEITRQEFESIWSAAVARVAGCC